MIPREQFDAYNRAVANLSDGAQREIESGIWAWLKTDEGKAASVAECREYAKAVMSGVVQRYDEAAASLAAQWYDSQAEDNHLKLAPAITAAVYDPKRVDETARYQANKLLKGDLRGFAKYCGELGRNDVLRSLNETIMANAGRDKDKGAMFARIPTGFETCTFCLMLASRGSVYYTRKTAGEFKHFHRGCDCKVVPSFDPDPEAEVVEGVKPRELYEQWKACKRVDDEISAPSLTKAAVKRQLIINPAASLNAPLEVAVPWLRAIDMYYVPDRKIDAYALSYTGNDNKATVFELVLGFAPCDAAELIRQLYEWIANNPPIKNREDIHGERFESETMMTGRNGKKASVISGWIRRPGESIMQLTSIRVKKKTKRRHS